MNQVLRYWDDVLRYHRIGLVQYMMAYLLSFSSMPTAFGQQWIYKDLFSSRDFGNTEFKSILYGSDGFLYLGTTEGLFKTDGFNKSPVPFQDSLKVQSITALSEYSKDELLIGTSSGHLIKIHQLTGEQQHIVYVAAEIRDILFHLFLLDLLNDVAHDSILGFIHTVRVR